MGKKSLKNTLMIGRLSVHSYKLEVKIVFKVTMRLDEISAAHQVAFQPLGRERIVIFVVVAALFCLLFS